MLLITFSHDYYRHCREKIDVGHSKVKRHFHENFAEKYFASAYKMTVVFVMNKTRKRSKVENKLS